MEKHNSLSFTALWKPIIDGVFDFLFMVMAHAPQSIILLILFEGYLISGLILYDLLKAMLHECGYA